MTELLVFVPDLIIRLYDKIFSIQKSSQNKMATDPAEKMLEFDMSLCCENDCRSLHLYVLEVDTNAGLDQPRVCCHKRMTCF